MAAPQCKPSNGRGPSAPRVGSSAPQVRAGPPIHCSATALVAVGNSAAAEPRASARFGTPTLHTLPAILCERSSVCALHCLTHGTASAPGLGWESHAQTTQCFALPATARLLCVWLPAGPTAQATPPSACRVARPRVLGATPKSVGAWQPTASTAWPKQRTELPPPRAQGMARLIAVVCVFGQFAVASASSSPRPPPSPPPPSPPPGHLARARLVLAAARRRDHRAHSGHAAGRRAA